VHFGFSRRKFPEVLVHILFSTNCEAIYLSCCSKFRGERGKFDHSFVFHRDRLDRKRRNFNGTKKKFGGNEPQRKTFFKKQKKKLVLSFFRLADLGVGPLDGEVEGEGGALRFGLEEGRLSSKGHPISIPHRASGAHSSVNQHGISLHVAA